MTFRKNPLVWYVGAAYQIPAGIEAHLLHYATEMRHHGFDTKVVVFKPLPPQPHRFLQALYDRGIPIESLADAARTRARLRTVGLFVPWVLYHLTVKQHLPALRQFRYWAGRRSALARLVARLRAEAPDLIHIFGRLPTEAWVHFPPERTIFHEMMTGTVDRHWTEDELRDFRKFAERIARFFAPGKGVADNVRREFMVTRNIDPIFTMCPDEVETVELDQLRKPFPPAAGPAAGTAGAPLSDTKPAETRFGVICRLTGQKGIQFLLEALREYRARHGVVNFTFGGIGPMETQIREFAARHGLHHVRVVRVRNAPEILRELDLFVHPSVDDAMPMAIAEALMCGVPCLVCRVGGVPDLVRDGVEGFVIEPRNAAQILDGMERFAALSPRERHEFRRRARARYEAVCRPDKVGGIVAEHYRHVLEAARKRPDRR